MGDGRILERTAVFIDTLSAVCQCKAIKRKQQVSIQNKDYYEYGTK